MAKESFWGGFALGAAAGIAGFAVASGAAGSYDKRILRLERSIQIARPVEEVFAEWSRLESLPEKISCLRRVDVSGQHSNWVLEVDGRPFEFAAETEQVIPNQAIGWKSVNGPKHSGRINFARLGNDTLVHVTMNYAPPFGRLLAPVTDHLESEIERALRDFKRSLEGLCEGSSNVQRKKASDAAMERWGHRPPASAGWDESNAQRATGTDGASSLTPPSTRIEDQSGKVQTPGAVDYTRPPKDRY
jgi:uncharacterized membrane protein